MDGRERDGKIIMGLMFFRVFRRGYGSKRSELVFEKEEMEGIKGEEERGFLELCNMPCHDIPAIHEFSPFAFLSLTCFF